jgi:hypothetical protein
VAMNNKMTIPGNTLLCLLLKFNLNASRSRCNV